MNPILVPYRRGFKTEFENASDEVLLPLHFKGVVSCGQKKEIGNPKANFDIYPVSIRNLASKTTADSTIGYAFCVDNSTFAQSDVNGKITLSNVPKGTHSIYLWHPSANRRLKICSASDLKKAAKFKTKMEMTYKGETLLIKIVLDLKKIESKKD